MSHQVAMALTEKEYKVSHIKQDHSYVSDFDRLAKRLKGKKKIKDDCTGIFTKRTAGNPTLALVS